MKESPFNDDLMSPGRALLLGLLMLVIVLVIRLAVNA